MRSYLKSHGICLLTILIIAAIAAWTIVSNRPQKSAEQPVTLAPQGAGEPLGIPYTWLGDRYHILGKTNRPLGELVTMQGVLVEGPSKGYEDGPNLRIQRINDRATQDGTETRLRPYSGSKATEWEKSLHYGKTYELRGYEEGGYVGVPGKAFEEAGILLQTCGFYFHLDFVVLKAKEIKPIAFEPADH
jgi:hypothetical protein